MKNIYFTLILVSLIACKTSTKNNNKTDSSAIATDTVHALSDSIPGNVAKRKINSGEALKTSFTTNTLVGYAKTLLGTPYKYASSNPSIGFDCSGFITYVFNHFNIEVPRSSVGFTNVGKEVGLNDAKEGDLILFTGTQPGDTQVGHMGIVVDNKDSLSFIHSSSGRANAVTINALTSHYKTRFVKVIRVIE